MRKLEVKYRDELVVLGVQSPKYTAEGDPDNLRKAVQRLEIEHPVLNDPEFRVWDAYAIRAWPTLVFISPEGKVIGQHAGEAEFEALDRVVAEMVREYGAVGALDAVEARPAVDSFSRPLSELSFPGRVLATGDRLFIADSGHNRVLVSDLEGAVKDVIGTGEPGLQDGDYTSATFHAPQGMALDSERDLLYIADAENHAVRAVNLSARSVLMVGGTGAQARRALRSGPATETRLSSPWDLVLHAGVLYVAMAGTHQVWALDLRAGKVTVWAGTGHEAIGDGPRQSAWFAQPMGLAMDGNRILVACAETQAVRAIHLDSDQVTTLTGRGLFDFGDEDGPADTALLQHPQAVTAVDGIVYVADTYNNKIKALDPRSEEVATWVGSGVGGQLDGPGRNARLDQPQGLSQAGMTMYVADTNNHSVRTVEIESGVVRTLQLTGLT